MCQAQPRPGSRPSAPRERLKASTPADNSWAESTYNVDTAVAAMEKTTQNDHDLQRD